MRKLLYLGGTWLDDGRTHPITRFHPFQDDKADPRPHAVVPEDYGEAKIAAEPDNFRWADAPVAAAPSVPVVEPEQRQRRKKGK